MPTKRNSKNTWIWPLIIFALAVGFYFFGSSDGTFPQQIIPESTNQEVKGEATETPIESPIVISKGGYYELYFTNPNNPKDSTVEQALINKIDGSNKSIDMAVFEFDIEAVAQAINRAEKRGVDVRVVYDNEYTDTDPQMSEVKSAGVSVVPDDRSALMHNKFFVFDDACVWTGSFNISNNASHKNNENAIYFCSSEAAKNYSTEFYEMYSGQFGPSSPSNTPYPIFTIAGVTIENCFAPEDNCMEKVIKAVSSADTSIHFMAFSFTDDNLGNAMIEDANRGVEVEGIFETRGANSTYTDTKTKKQIQISECFNLLNKGIDVRLDGNSATFHHKVIIVDSKYVIFGSFNFSGAANESNDENLLIWYDPALASEFEQQYQLMKSQAVVPSGNTCTK